MRQQDFASDIGVSGSVISELETGTRNVSADTLLKISQRTGISLKKLLSYTPAPSSPQAGVD